MKNFFEKTNELIFLFVNLLIITIIIMIFAGIIIGPSFNPTIPFSEHGGFIVFPIIYFVLSMFIDCCKSKKSQWMWLFVQLFFPILGASVYYWYFRFFKKRQ